MSSISNTKRYILGGFLFGLLFPFFSWILDGIFFRQMPLNIETIANLHVINPIHFVIDSAPFVLGGAFGTIGFYVDRLKESSLLRHENIDKYNTQNKAIINRMRLSNTVFPIMIALILSIGFLILQDLSHKEQDNIFLIKIATNQRTLSQKIAFYSSRIPTTEQKEKIRYTDSLLISLKNLKEGHQNLTQKSFTLGINKEYTNSENVQTLFDSLENSYQNIIINIDELLNPTFSIKNVDSLSIQNYAYQTIRQLEKNQESFSSLMQSIVNNYEKEAKDMVANLKLVQFVVIVIIMFFVINLAIFGLRPMIDRVKQAFLDVEETNTKFLLENEKLQASQADLKKSSQEMRTITDHLMNSQYELEQKQDLLKRAEKMSKMGSFVWELENQVVTYSDNLPTIYRLEKTKQITPSIFKEISHHEDYKANQELFLNAADRNQKELITHYRARPILSEEDRKNTTNQEIQKWKHYRAVTLISYDREGEPSLLTGTVQDVTEEVERNAHVKTLFEEAEKNRERLEEAQRQAMIVSYDKDVVLEQTQWSSSFSDVFHVDQKDIPTTLEDFRNWIEAEDYEKIEHKWQQALGNQVDFDAIYRVNVPRRAMLYIREKGYPSFDKNGVLVSKRGTLQDITKSEIARLNIEQKSKQIKQQNDDFVASVNYAKRIQFAMLGSIKEIKTIFKDSFVFFSPKDIVSGDFYWFAELGNKKIVIVGDCTGHGVPGAFMSLLGTTLLNEIILQRQISSPNEILNELQVQIKDALKQDITKNRDGMDIAVVVIDETNNQLEFAGAKNPLVYMHKKRQRGGQEANMSVVKGDNLSIGGRTKKAEDRRYTSHSIELNEVEAFYLYSDGYQDQFGGENGRKFMSKRFRSLLYETYTSSMLHQRRALKQNLVDWMGVKANQIDDICIIGITI